jgi:hypothetical protein
MGDRIRGVWGSGGVAWMTPVPFQAPGSVAQIALLEDNYMGLARGGE